jgi:hypothetical protein
MLGLLQDTFSEDPESLSDTAYAGSSADSGFVFAPQGCQCMQKHVLQSLRSWLRTACRRHVPEGWRFWMTAT